MPPKNRQSDIHSEIRLTKRAKSMIDAYAGKHHMSRSEVMRWVIEQIIAGQLPNKRPQRRTERVPFYDPGKLIDRLGEKARREGIPATDLLDQAIEEIFND